MSNLEISQAERLDLYVVRQLPELSRSAAEKLIEQGKVQVNGVPEYKGGYKVREADKIAIDYNPATASQVPRLELSIIYEDKDCVVVNKPAGLLTHSKGAFNPEPTVATWLHQHVAEQAAKRHKPHLLEGMSSDRAGIVHRLDRATSGVIICAKTPEALSWLQKQFAQRRTKKTYAAVVQGSLQQPQAVIDMPIERNPKRPQTFRVGAGGKPAITAYSVLASNGDLSLVELTPTTGRTHQLRVHMAHIGHPIVGDVLYGGKPAERMFLHAERLELTVPSKSRQVFEAATPAEFAELVA